MNSEYPKYFVADGHILDHYPRSTMHRRCNEKRFYQGLIRNMRATGYPEDAERLRSVLHKKFK